MKIVENIKKTISYSIHRRQAMECTACDAEFDIHINFEGVYGVSIDFCPFCGEALDNEEYEEDNEDDE
jgi:rRNA maturation endonuclease Nob1